VSLPTVEKGGSWYRVADPDWVDPLDGSYSRAHGGRWNAPGSFDVLYLARDYHCARTYVLHKLDGLPYGPEDLRDDTAPQLVAVEVPPGTYADGQRANDGALDGIVCRSASPRAGKRDEELAHIPRADRAPLVAGLKLDFSRWFWS
jgi:RES domain